MLSTFAMNLPCNYFQILLVVCCLKFDNPNNQVDAKNYKIMEKYVGDYYGKYDVQESPQAFKNNTELSEFDKGKETPKMIIKKIGKHKKKWKKTDEKEKYIMMKKKKISKNKQYEKTKRKKSPTKFVKTISDKNKDSNMSGSKEVAAENISQKPDIIVHIVK